MHSMTSLFLAEAFGTGIIILFGAGVVSGSLLNKTKSGFTGGLGVGWVGITMAWAIGVVLGLYASGPISGGHLNPAVSIALAMSGSFDWNLVPLYIAGQFAGAMAASFIVFIAYYPHWSETDDKGAKLGIFCTGPAIRNIPANFATEFIATFIFLFCIMVIGANKFADGMGPLMIGMLILGMGLSFGGVTGYAMNPARDLGPRIMHALMPIPGKGDSDWSYAWVPVVAPIMGAIAGVMTHIALFQ